MDIARTVGILKFAECCWTGEISLDGDTNFGEVCDLEELAPNLGFVLCHSNVIAVQTTEGLVLIDSCCTPFAKSVFDQIRKWRRNTPVHTVIFTHGHLDHVQGINVIEKEQREMGYGPIKVVAHANIIHRFEQYKKMGGFNSLTGHYKHLKDWPQEYRYPDQTFNDQLTFKLGQDEFQLFHDTGAADDHTWVWIPTKKVLCTGNLFTWGSPNCGNPQSVQSYPLEWCQALRKMEQLGAELLLPGRGPPIIGRERVKQALADTAQYLESIIHQSLELMNKGMKLNDILHTVKPPEELEERPYLQPIFDEPEFIIRNLWRLYGGWWDGNPSSLLPPADRDIAKHVCELAGGSMAAAKRAIAAASAGNFRLAAYLIELAWLDDPTNVFIARTRKEIYLSMSELATSKSAKEIFLAAAAESTKQAKL